MTIKEKIKRGENRYLEFKESLPSSQKIAKTVIAFANSAGGDILIGVNDERKVIGVADDELLDIPDKIPD
ncbi:MAG: ATP-binding protein, partial [Thermotogota bacterium]|nr:ATP-binding protein [Thermotogota bacterium]